MYVVSRTLVGSCLACPQEVLRTAIRLALLICCAGVLASPAEGQPPHAPDHQMPTIASPARAWSWTSDGNVFFGFNYQHREFTDFRAWESQNWFMLSGEHAVGAGHVMLHGMASLEPFTMQRLGSPQVFQTGESYKGAPLIDRQHPHDLLMQLGATYSVQAGPATYVLGADLVGSPTLGPTPFMHRESARNNPQAPLAHHYLDATHTTPGVLRGSVELPSGFAAEGSWFRGEEPNDNRLNIERPRLNSWAARGRWRRGPWRAQMSGGRLHKPEWFEPYDVTQLTASIEFAGTIGARPVAATLAWGENREVHGALDGYLLEWNVRAASRGWLYGRAEATAKDLLDLGGPHPPGFIEFHRISHVAALTVGYAHDVWDARGTHVAVGSDVTLYRVPNNMLEYYGAPHSFHFFVRWRPNGFSTGHIH